jgi:hypothetical protein
MPPHDALLVASQLLQALLMRYIVAYCDCLLLCGDLLAQLELDECHCPPLNKSAPNPLKDRKLGTPAPVEIYKEFAAKPPIRITSLQCENKPSFDYHSIYGSLDQVQF